GLHRARRASAPCGDRAAQPQDEEPGPAPLAPLIGRRRARDDPPRARAPRADRLGATMRRTPPLLLALVLSACGVLGDDEDDTPPPVDPALQAAPVTPVATNDPAPA